MTWVSLGATAIAAAGSIGSAALSRRGGGQVAMPQMAPDQKTGPTKPTAADFQTPPIAPQQPAPQVPMPQAPQPQQLPPVQQAAMQSVPQDAQLGDFLRFLRQGEY